LRRAHWERQLAEAHYGLGELPKSRDRLKRAIHILGWKTPEKGLGLLTNLVGEVIKQMRFRMNPKPIVEGQLPTYLEDTSQAKILEGGMSFVRLGHIYYQMNLTFPLIFTVLNAVNLSEESGLKSPSLVRSYASMCVVSGVLPRHDWAIAYRDRSHEAGRVVNDLPALSYALSGCAVYELGAALWEDATKSLNEAIEIDGRIGNVRHYDESKTILSIVLYHQGQYQQGLEVAAEVLERATLRKDVISQVWAHSLRAEMLLRKSEPDTLNEAIEAYETSLKLLEQSIDLASDIRASGALALAYWRKGEPVCALDMATVALKKAKGNPTAPYAMEGYAGAAEVFLQAWQNGDVKYRSVAMKACKAMKKFAGVFPLGRPRLKLYQGWFEWLDGKPQKAQLQWQAALVEAEKLNMPYEHGLAYLYLGEHSLMGAEKNKALKCALAIFERIDARREAEQARFLVK